MDSFLLLFAVAFAAASLGAYVTVFMMEKSEEPDVGLVLWNDRPKKGNKESLHQKTLRFWRRISKKSYDPDTETIYFALHFLVYIQSGMTVMAALRKTYASLSVSGFGIARYLKEIIFRLDSGVPFKEAVSVLNKQPGAELLRELFMAMMQAQEIGVPLGDSLRNTIRDFEQTRVFRAEERASKMSVLLAIPIVFGFLPSIMMLLLYPAMHNIFEILKGMAR